MEAASSGAVSSTASRVCDALPWLGRMVSEIDHERRARAERRFRKLPPIVGSKARASLVPHSNAPQVANRTRAAQGIVEPLLRQRGGQVLV